MRGGVFAGATEGYYTKRRTEAGVTPRAEKDRTVTCRKYAFITNPLPLVRHTAQVSAGRETPPKEVVVVQRRRRHSQPSLGTI